MLFIRKEKKNDHKEVARILFALSQKKEKPYAYSIDSLRNTKNWIKDLTFVVESDGKTIGLITLVKAKIVNENEKERETLFVMGPFVDEEFVNQGAEERLIKTVINEAKFLGYHHIFALNDEAQWNQYGFVSIDFNAMTLQDPSFKDGFVLCFKDEYQDELKGELQLPSLLDEKKEEVNSYQEKIENEPKASKGNQRKVTLGAFAFSMLFTIAAIVLFILRMKGIISPELGLGSIVIAIGGCFSSIGVSYLVTNRKTMGWFAIFLSFIIILLGVISIFN